MKSFLVAAWQLRDEDNIGNAWNFLGVAAGVNDLFRGIVYEVEPCTREEVVRERGLEVVDAAEHELARQMGWHLFDIEHREDLCKAVIRPGQSWLCTLPRGHDGECVSTGGYEVYWYRYEDRFLQDVPPDEKTQQLRQHLDTMKSDPVFCVPDVISSAHGPVTANVGKWYYWDETRTNSHGPFDTEDICRNNLRVYMESLKPS